MASNRILREFLNFGFSVKHSIIEKVNKPAANPHACFQSFICNKDVTMVSVEKVKLVTKKVKKIRILRLPTQLFNRVQW
jgi:hypothetical protein